MGHDGHVFEVEFVEKKLSIIVTRYKEPWEVCRYLFDSIAIQQGIDFDDIEVIIINDGKDDTLDEFIFDHYPFDTKYRLMDHGGVSKARNYGLSLAQGKYVQFCDIDDMYLSNYGMHMLFSAIQEGFDVLITPFIEEQKTNEGFRIIRHPVNDATFIHGKLFNREFLTNADLNFNEDLTIHEDGFFVSLAIACADNKRTIETPFYLWKYNEASVVRRDSENFVLKTYDHVVRCRIALCRELYKRGYVNEYFDLVAKTFFDTYYQSQKPEALDSKNSKILKDAEYSFKKFYKEFKKDFNEMSQQRKAEIAKYARDTAFVSGAFMEQKSFREWVKHIEYQVV